MIEGVVIFIGGTLFGAVIGFVAAFERFMRTEKPVVKLEVTQDVLKDLSSQIVGAWLEVRGLTWMPKGLEFKPKVKP